MSKIIGIQTGPVDSKKAGDSGQTAAGLALAETLCAEVVRQSRNTYVTFVKGMMELNEQGRRVFRKALSAWVKQVKENAITGVEPAYEAQAKRAANSAVVRVSQCRTIATAIDRGFKPDLTKSFDNILAAARLVTESQAAKGPTVRRGRPSKNTIEKVKAYLARLVKAGELDAQGLHQVAEVAEDLAEHPEQVKAAA